MEAHLLSLPTDSQSHTEAFKRVWLTRYGSLTAAAELAERLLTTDNADERLKLRMRLLLQRLAPQSPGLLSHYDQLAQAMLLLGDRPGYLIARSFACGAEHYGGDVAAALSAYETLLPEIYRLEDPLEQHAALGAALLLYQAHANHVAYMQQACRMLQLANEVGHSGMRAAAISNLGIAWFLGGDETQARSYLEESLSGTDLGGWIRFGTVGLLAEVYTAAGEIDKVVPLLRVWSFPRRPDEFHGPALLQFHALGAEVFARLGQPRKMRAYLRFLDNIPDSYDVGDVQAMVAVSRALHLQAQGRAAQAQAALDEALQWAQPAVGVRPQLAARFWWMAAEVSGALGHWEQAYKLLDRYRRLEQDRKAEIAAVRRVAAQVQVDASARAVEAAQRDRLTGLGNRERLINVGEAWLARKLAPLVAMMNVRRFNAINEALGREIADAVLQAVADRLREACNRFGHAAAGRVYADQFAVVVAGGRRDLQLMRQIAEEIFSKPLAVAGQWVDISAAWGVAHCPAHGSTMHRLLSHAEIALHEAMRTDSGLTVYDASLVRADPRQLSLISELKRAAQEDEFTLLLQPKFRLSDGAVTCFESLIRWDHATRGTVPPTAFIPFAESTGSIRGITRWVLARAMRLSCRLQQAGVVAEISVNVSVHDVGAHGFRDSLVQLLKETGARAEHIRLELTEGAVMKDPATVIDRMREINALGFEWSIDDFGTGQSSLAYLHMLPVSELKIDRSFVRGAATSSTTLTLLKAAIDLGRNLGLTTVGEGAETAEEWALLRHLGCDVAQGWFGARPMQEHELLAWLRERNAGRAG